MPRRTVSLRLIETYVKNYLRLLSGELKFARHQLDKVFRSGQLRLGAESLMEEGSFCSPELAVDFYMLTLPELPRISRTPFPFVFFIPRDMNSFAANPEQPRRECFLGCRFDGHERRLKELLDSLLGYYGYRATLLDASYGEPQLLEKAFRKIRSRDIDFALFDNRAAEGKPNVYIELGMAFAIKKPFILLQHGRSVLPADLIGLSTLRYSSYEELAQKLALQLPPFLRSSARRVPPL
ncbi:MAG TPA: hypothetical protein VF756_25490 [Thermoanaerobaculia bacterium]